MYDYIKGAVDSLTPTSVVVEAAGVGYWLNISLQTYTSISSKEEVKIYTHFIVREDVQILYGFFDRAEREIFRYLLGVSGVGGNTARMILSTFSSGDVVKIISTGQADMLKTVKGLGLKTAQKIIVELRDKIGIASSDGVSISTGGASEVYSEALSALLMLGFVKAASEKVLRDLRNDNPTATVEELIRLALKKL